MCLYPKLINNPKYKPNKKNGGVIPAVYDDRVKLVPVGCGNCIECRNQKSREWRLRLLEDVRVNKNAKMVTFTLSNKSYTNLWHEISDQLEGYDRDNAIITLAVRRFLERWRKKYKKSVRHWFVSELGHEGTENIHIHGIIWMDKTRVEVEERWQYGFMWPRYDDDWATGWVAEDTVNYIVKYITKIDLDHKYYKSIVLTSAGIGSNYTKRPDAKRNEFKEADTTTTYKTREGYEQAMPIYWRNKLYNDEQREKLWLHLLDKNERWVLGQKCKADDYNSYNKLLEEARIKNARLGYGTDVTDWNRKQYEKQVRLLKQMARLNYNNKKQN